VSLVVLNGLTGTVEVDGRSISGVMPSFWGVDDADLATILSYVSSLPGPEKRRAKPFTSSEIAGARAEGRISSAKVAVTRPKDVVP
jgi:hypothetical protein